MTLRVWFGGVLVLVAGQASALSLGQLQGQAVLGQHLNLHIPIGLASGESPADLCPTVRVFFGEDLLPNQQVRASVRPDKTGAGAVLHLTTGFSLNEPYAKIDVVVGCVNQFSRSYTVLSDLPAVEQPSHQRPPIAIRPAVVAPQQPVVPAPSTSSGVVGSPSAVESDSVRARALAFVRGERPAVAAPAVKTAPTSTKRVPVAEVRTMADAAVAGPKLKLDPVELMAAVSGLSPTLKWSDQDSFRESVEDPQTEQRRAAARELWRVLNASPEQLAASKLQSESASVASTQQLQAQLAAARQAEAAAREQAMQAEEAVYTHPLVLVLGGGLIAALAALAVVLRRRDMTRGDDARGAMRPWWRRKAEPVDSQAEEPVKVSLKDRLHKLVPVRRQPVDIDVDTLVPQVTRPETSAVEPTRQGAPVSRSFHSTLPGNEFLSSTLLDGGRSVATEELFDLQQQVEFFISLGQAEQAVEVLVNHLSDSHEPSPLAYLDLLKLYHELGMRADYENLRVDFNRLFSGGAPAFDDYSYSRRGLERYESAISRIQALWPKPEVLDVIEKTIFRQDNAENNEVFDLEAYRELLLLYGIAREIIAPQSQPAHPFTASGSAYLVDGDANEGDKVSPVTDTVLQPLVSQTRESRERSDALLPANVPAEPVFAPTAIPEFSESGLDIDLSADFASDAPAVRSSELDLDLDLDGMTFDLPDLEPTTGSPSDERVSDPNASLLAELNAPSAMLPGSHLEFDGLDNLSSYTIRKTGRQP